MPAHASTGAPNQAVEQYPVRQAAGYQQSDGTISHSYSGDRQSNADSSNQWRTRSNPRFQGGEEFQQSASSRYSSDGPQLTNSAPAQGWSNRSYQDASMPDTEIPRIPSTPGSSQDYGIGTSVNQGQAYNTESPLNIVDRPPAIEDYTTDPFNDVVDTEPRANSTPQSVLVRDRSLRNVAPSNQSGNQLRDVQMQPRRLRGVTTQSRAGKTGSRFRNSSTTRKFRQLENLQDNDLDYTGNEGRGLKSCDEYRTELLNNPITDIVLDISPIRPSVAAQVTPDGMTRTWSDCNGNTMGVGTLIGLEHSHVVIRDDSGVEHRIARSNLSDADIAVVTSYWGLPNECTLGCFEFEERRWMANSFFWKASALCHKPLYFENKQLERYGHSHGPIVEPIHSTAHFFTSLILLPYNTGINPPHECLYALGFYRPGDCAPWLKEPFPLSMQGAVRQAAFIGVAAVIIP